MGLSQGVRSRMHGFQLFSTGLETPWRSRRCLHLEVDDLQSRELQLRCALAAQPVIASEIA